MSAKATPIVVVKASVSDDAYLVVDLFFKDGDAVKQNDVLGAYETSKSVVDVTAPESGYVYFNCKKDAQVQVGDTFAVVSAQPVPAAEVSTLFGKGATSKPVQSTEKSASHTSFRASQEARALMEKHGIDGSAFSGKSLVTKKDVEAVIQQQSKSQTLPRIYGGKDVAEDPVIEAIASDPEVIAFKQTLHALRKRLWAEFHRHVPLGTLLHDRWELASNLGFGEKSSVYDECLIMGDVQVGAHTWIGPYTILDAAGAALVIGEHCSIGSGTHVYTHNTIDWALTRGKAAYFYAPTRIGNACFIAPQVVIGPGTEIGDHSFVATGSYVQGKFPPYSFISGNPARRTGEIEIQGSRVKIRRFKLAD